MKTKKMVNKVYEILNRSKKLEIASILVDFESEHVVLIGGYDKTSSACGWGRLFQSAGHR